MLFLKKVALLIQNNPDMFTETTLRVKHNKPMTFFSRTLYISITLNVIVNLIGVFLYIFTPSAELEKIRSQKNISSGHRK